MASEPITTSSTANHPVWTVYDRLRDACLNTKYFGRRLSTIKRLNLALDLILAISAPSSAVTGLWLWNTTDGQIAWKIFSILSALIAVTKPLLGQFLSASAYEAVLSGYKTILFDLKEIKTSIEQRKTFDEEAQDEFERVKRYEKLIIDKDPESSHSQRLRRICDSEVREEYPVKSFYIPED